MGRIKSLEELVALRDSIKNATGMRMTAQNPNRIVLAVGMATCGIAAGARETLRALNECVLRYGLGNVSVMATGCLGYCYAEPVVEVRVPGAEPILYGHVDASRAEKIITEHIIGGRLLDNAIIGRGVQGV